VCSSDLYLATAATAEPSVETDGLLLAAHDIVALGTGEVVRYRSARSDGSGAVVRRAKA
jgi:hypothetical protein